MKAVIIKKSLHVKHARITLATNFNYFFKDKRHLLSTLLARADRWVGRLAGWAGLND